MTNNQARNELDAVQTALTEANGKVTALETHSNILKTAHDNYLANTPANDEEAGPDVYEDAVRLRGQAETFRDRIPTPEA
jgi:hypothetical protein